MKEIKGTIEKAKLPKVKKYIPLYKTVCSGNWVTGRICDSLKEVKEFYPEYKKYPSFYTISFEDPGV